MADKLKKVQTLKALDTNGEEQDVSIFEYHRVRIIRTQKDLGASRQTNIKHLPLESIEGEVSRVSCLGERIERLYVPSNVKRIDCTMNRLTELEIEEGVNEVECVSNYLKRLVLPSSLKILNCGFNFIEELVLPENIRSVRCDRNVHIKNLEELLDKRGDDIDVTMT